MKAWLVREKDEFCATVVFAETRGKARALKKKLVRKVDVVCSDIIQEIFFIALTEKGERHNVKKTEVICDRCGAEITHYDIKISSARIDVWGLGVPRSYSGQRIDLCPDCYQDFVNFLEGGAKNENHQENKAFRARHGGVAL